MQCTRTACDRCTSSCMCKAEGSDVQCDIDLVLNGRGHRKHVQRQVWQVLLPVFLFLIFELFLNGGCLCRTGGEEMLVVCVCGWRAESVKCILKGRSDLGPGIAGAHHHLAMMSHWTQDNAVCPPPGFGCKSPVCGKGSPLCTWKRGANWGGVYKPGAAHERGEGWVLFAYLRLSISICLNCGTVPKVMHDTIPNKYVSSGWPSSVGVMLNVASIPAIVNHMLARAKTAPGQCHAPKPNA